MIDMVLEHFELTRRDFDIRFKRKGRRYKIPAFSAFWFFVNAVKSALFLVGLIGWYLMLTYILGMVR